MLFNERYLDAFLEAGAQKESLLVESIFLPPMANKKIAEIRKRINEDWPMLVSEKLEKKSYSTGFDENLTYFRLDFLNQARVEAASSLSDIIPLLWMKFGSIGSVPACHGAQEFFFPRNSRFAVLVQSYAIRRFLAELKKRPGIDWAF